jgi:predicted permease
MWTTLLTRLRGLLQRPRVAREMDDELRFHVEMETESNIARGLSPSEARRVALRDLGGVEQTKEDVRDVRALSIDGLWRDVRYALRGMRKAPTFTVLAVVTLALGIGVNTASLAVAYDILVRPLPYAEPSRVVIVNLRFPDGSDLGFSPTGLQEWLPRLRTVDAAAAYYRREVTVRSGGRSAIIPAAFVTDEFFDVLGAPVEFGSMRPFDDTSAVAIGRRALGQIVSGDPSAAVGMPVSVSEQARTIGSVMPSDFAFPSDEIGLWLHSAALTPGTTSESSGYSKIVARLKPGLTPDHVRDDANRIRLELNPTSRESVSVDVLGESVVGGLRSILLIAIAGALLVLLVASANVATLFVGRDIARRREHAARLALGATPRQLVRSVLVETSLIALLASLVGVGLGAAALQVFVSQAANGISGLHRVTIGIPTVLAIVSLTIIVTMVCVAVPAWHAARADLSDFLRATAASRPRAGRFRNALVVAQIGLSCVLLIGAGLLTRTVTVLMRQDHGFQPDGALEAKIVLSDRVLFDGAGRETFVAGLLERVRAMPGVLHAGVGTNLPPRPPQLTILMRVVRDDFDDTRFMKVGSATPGYLRALGAQFIAGRDFVDADGRPDAPGVVMSESLARFYFADEDPVGRTMSRLPAIFGTTAKPRIIGVVRDIKYEGLDSPSPSALYLPWAVRPLGSGYLIVRVLHGDPMRVAADIRRAIQTLDPAVPVPELQSLDDAMAQSISNRRVRALPAVGFGLLSLGVAFAGVLATLSTLVTERRRDLAIRSAVGASPSQLTWTIVGHGLALTTAGLAVGIGLGGAAARGLSSLLYGISPYDATTFGGTALVIGAGTMLMTYVAALRTRAVDPLIVLKHE